MSTDRYFGLNSILPSGYMNKAEAFAKCLQDKLRSLGSGEDSSPSRHADDDLPKTPHGSLTKFTDEEIADNVFLQGPLAYKRRSIPEHSNKTYTNGKTRGKYIGSLVDKRGMSSDSEDSDVEDVVVPTVHPRVAELQSSKDERLKRLTSVTSVDSASSWCSCEEGPDPDDDEEVIDTFAAQIKGSPPIHKPRMRNFKRKSREEKVKVEPHPPPQQEADLFFDFDVECFSPVNMDDEEEDLINSFGSAELRLQEKGSNPWDHDFTESFDTGQNADALDSIPAPVQPVVTPPPSPVNANFNIPLDKLDINDDKDVENKSIAESLAADIAELNESDMISADKNLMKQSNDIESSPDLLNEQGQQEIEQRDNESNEYNTYAFEMETKDSGIGSCEETSSRTGDDYPLDIVDTCEEALEGEVTVETEGEEKNEATKTEVHPPVMVLCDGVEIDENYLPSPRKLRRCSSLKTWKTPPGTPGRKKIVRFADALGLDLADVRMFLDEIPKIPNSAYEDLHYDLPSAPAPLPVERTLIPMFQQPGTQLDFLQRVRQNNVCLESAILTDISLLAINGIVRVRNLSFHKTVHVRYSIDDWKTFSDLQATFIPNSSDGFCDNFSFALYGHTLNIGDRLEFAIRYDCTSGQFWDSNSGANYAFQCLPRSPMPLFAPLGSSPVDTWNNKFY